MRGLGATTLVSGLPVNPAPYRFTGARLLRPGETASLAGGVIRDTNGWTFMQSFLNGTKILGNVSFFTFISSDILDEISPAYCEILWLSKNSQQNDDNANIYVAQEDFGYLIHTGRAITASTGAPAHQSAMVNYKKGQNIPECVIGMRSASETFSVWANETLIGSEKTPPSAVTQSYYNSSYTTTRKVSLGFGFQTQINTAAQPPKDPDQFILLQPHEFRYPERLKP